ncbi:hypothetical protein M1506_01030 [Patescibacteria group bacterium]|nr:hypothetical protein [Patescibacteria group bacterium]
MALKINSEKNKREDASAIPFIEFYLQNFFPDLSEVTLSYPDDISQHKMPDYFVEEPKLLIEFKEVHDREYVSSSVAWARSANSLKNRINDKGASILDGIYFIDAPDNLRVRQSDLDKLADQLLDAIKNRSPKLDLPDFGTFEISRFDSEDKKVVFATSGGVKAIDPPSTVNANISAKIEIANEQLGSYKKNVSKRILVLSNRYFFATETSTFIEALSRDYEKLLKYKNIDEVWLQVQPQDSDAIHEIIYTREFLEKINGSNFDFDSREVTMFERWFIYLEKFGDPYKGKLFTALSQMLKSKSPHQLFRDPYIRSEMADLGSWLIEQKRFSDTLWLIDKFIDDPDPPEPGHGSIDKRFNYHKEIAEGGDPLVITTVLGRLAWVIQRITPQQEYIGAAFNYTKKLLAHKNLYVKLEAVIPLTEIAARRQWLDGWKERPLRGQYKDFHDVVFSLIELVKDNPTYVAIAKSMTRIFAYYKDLTTNEAEDVLDTLKITDEAASLFIYFGLFRERHYQDLNIEFDGKILKQKLTDVVSGKTVCVPHLRGSIAWHFWKLLETNPEEFDNVKPYVDLFFQQPYDHDVYGKIEFILRDWMSKKPDVCIAWTETFLDRMLENLDAQKGKKSVPNLWLMEMEELTPSIASYQPESLLEIMGKLVDLWKRGVFIGDLNRIFASFRAIINDNDRQVAKQRFQEWYRSMRELNTKLIEILWD